MKIAICEDEIQVSLELKTMVEASGGEVTLYPDAKSFLADWDQGARFDVVFTDVVMENKSAGMELCRRLGAEEKVFLIIVTNYIEYAPEGYQYGVFRYLLKPIRQDALNRVFEEIEDQIQKQIQKSGKLVVGAFDGAHVISAEDILYVEVHGRYLDIHLRNERETESVVILMQSLKEFAAVLPKGRFARINRNQLVNLERIALIRPGKLILDSGGTLPVSRRQQKELQEALVRCLV